MYTSEEKLIIERFEPYKVITIKRNGKAIKEIKTRDTTITFKDLKKQYRIAQKLRVAPFVEFSFIDGRGRVYSTFATHIKDREQNYYLNALNRLKELKQKHKNINISVCAGV